MPSITFVKEFQANRERETQRLVLELAKPDADKVLLLTKDGCKACGIVKDWLIERGIHYSEKNVSSDQDARDYMEQITDSAKMLFPTVSYQSLVSFGIDYRALEEISRIYHANRNNQAA